MTAQLRTSPLVPTRVAVRAMEAFRLNEAAALAATLQLPLIESPTSDVDVVLTFTRERLELRDGRDPRVGAVYVDFSARRRLTPRDPLARAIGKSARFVVDATLGLGADAYMLARYGYFVMGIERHPAVAALVRDGLQRFMPTSRALRRENRPHHPNPLPEGEGTNATALLRREGTTAGVGLRLIEGRAHDLLPTLEPRPDAIYLDPMFPPKRRRSAAVSKEMRLLRLLAGDDTDAYELFAIARHVARERVVVKRPDHAEPLEPRPTVSYGGKLIRYDVYRTDLVRTP